MREMNRDYYPKKEDFLESNQEANILTVYRKVLADTETPISAFHKLSGKSYSYLLESAEGGDKLARYSFIGMDPFLIFQSKGIQVEISTEGKKEKYLESPFLSLRRLTDSFKVIEIDGLPCFFGGGVGYFGYDLVRFIERLPNHPKDDLVISDCILIYAGTLVVFDHLTHQMWIIAHLPLNQASLCREEAYEQAVQQIEKTISRLKDTDAGSLDKSEEIDKDRKRGASSKTKSNETREAFMEKVQKAREYIMTGDAFQIVLSQRLNRKSSRPREFHPQPLTEPDVSLSTHPALVIRSLALLPLSSAQRDDWNGWLIFANIYRLP
jgi:anthranilate synthase component I